MTVTAVQPLYASPVGLYPFQAEGVAYCYSRQDNLVTFETGTGKALRVDQRVATPDGWVPIGEMKVGDLVFGVDGKPHRVTGVFPQGVRPMWSVKFRDGVEVICDEDHLWNVTNAHRRWQGYEPLVLTVREMLDRGISVRAPGSKSSGKRAKFYVPMIDPVEYPEADLLIHPYTLGALIGDGGLTIRVEISGIDEDVVENMPLPEGVYSVREPDYDRWRFISTRGQSNPLWDAVRSLGINVKSEFKRVPRQYLHGSVDQRLDLLRGLMDTDGTISKGSSSFSSSSHGLVEDVIELVQSLGGVASSPSLKKTTHLDHWRTTISMPLCPFKIERKRSQWKPIHPQRAIVDISQVEDAEAVCISVDSPESLYLTEGYIATHNSHVLMATVALLFEDDLIDHALVVCEATKLGEWLADFEKFTGLNAGLYYGSPQKRAKIREDLPQVLITTYETARNDAVTKVEGKRRALAPHHLSLALEGKRMFVGYDEITVKIGASRTSQNHKAHNWMIQHLRKTGSCRVMGLTATPIERSPENIYNIGRVIAPYTMPTVADFERLYVQRRDIFGNATHFKNLDVETTEPGQPSLASWFEPIILRKRKTDPDVMAQFPQTVEEYTYVDLGIKHLDFYNTVRDTFDDGTEVNERLLFGLLRQIVAHPLSLMESQGKMAQAIVKAVGEDGLRAIGSAKTDRLVEYLIPLVLGQGAQAVVFSFYGPSVLPLLGEALTKAKIAVSYNHGQMSLTDRERSKDDFKSGKTRVFLSSDAGARGINLPEATYAIEYDMSLTHGLRVQRLNRIHRIDSNAPSVTFQTFIARNTVEEGIARLVMRRNEWSDQMLDNDDPEGSFVSAADRRKLIRNAREDEGV